MFSRLSSYFNKYNILYAYQFGFRKSYSTELSLFELSDKIAKAIDNNKLVIMLFLDLSKAFDTVDHNILIQKLRHYGIRGIPLQWFRSYLTSRKHAVSIEGCLSKFYPILCGVPQGSILGPLLFLIYINDMPYSSKNFIL